MHVLLVISVVIAIAAVASVHLGSVSVVAITIFPIVVVIIVVGVIGLFLSQFARHPVRKVLLLSQQLPKLSVVCCCVSDCEGAPTMPE